MCLLLTVRSVRSVLARSLLPIEKLIYDRVGDLDVFTGPVFTGHVNVVYVTVGHLSRVVAVQWRL